VKLQQDTSKGQKDKQLNEIEESVISLAQKRRNSSTPIMFTPDGPSELPDQISALKKSVSENACLLLDWTTIEAKMVGSLCKVFWDGEDTWFYARILNYDENRRLHYVRLFCSSCSILL
jgi:hypothetical protein